MVLKHFCSKPCGAQWQAINFANQQELLLITANYSTMKNRPSDIWQTMNRSR